MSPLVLFFAIYSLLALLTVVIYWHSAQNAKTDPELIDELYYQEKFISKSLRNKITKKLNIKLPKRKIHDIQTEVFA